MMSMENELWRWMIESQQAQPLARAAMHAFGDVPENFAYYEMERTDNGTIVTGAQFRPITRGPNKGNPKIIAGTERRVVVTREDSERFEDQFSVILQSVVGNWEIQYSRDELTFRERSEAIARGWELRDSDDFNIGRFVNGRLVSFDWMEQVVDSDAETLREIEEQL